MEGPQPISGTIPVLPWRDWGTNPDSCLRVRFEPGTTWMWHSIRWQLAQDERARDCRLGSKTQTARLHSPHTYVCAGKGMHDLNAEGEGGPASGQAHQERAGATPEGEQLADDTAYIIYSTEIQKTNNKSLHRQSDTRSTLPSAICCAQRATAWANVVQLSQFHRSNCTNTQNSNYICYFN